MADYPSMQEVLVAHAVARAKRHEEQRRLARDIRAEVEAFQRSPYAEIEEWFATPRPYTGLLGAWISPGGDGR